MGLRYVHAEPRERGDGWLELRLDENHKPPLYLATVRIFAAHTAVADGEHVRDVAAPVLARLACHDVADYLAKGRVLARARAALAGSERPARFEKDGLSFERSREAVPTALDPRERDVYLVRWEGEHSLSFWVAGGGAGGDGPPRSPALTAELYWVSKAFRADPRIKPRAVEHGYSYVPWALSELEAVRRTLLAGPRAIDLGLPLEVTDHLDPDRRL